MILRILGSPWTLIAIWIIGPAILIAIRQREKRRKESARKAAQGAVAPAPGPTPARAEREKTAATQVPIVGQEVTPGFRDLKWGDPPSESMELLATQGGEMSYMKRGEMLRVEDVPVEGIQYIFSGGGLSAVRIDAPIHVGDPLVRALSLRWGNPDTPDPRAMKQQWTHLVSGPMATAAVLEKNPVARRVTVLIFRKLQRPPA